MISPEWKPFFEYQSRIDLFVPVFHEIWEDMEGDQQIQLATLWSKLRGQIPDRIQMREKLILDLIDQMYEDVDFETFCGLNSKMIDIAAEVNELNILLRYEPTVRSVIIGS